MAEWIPVAIGSTTTTRNGLFTKKHIHIHDIITTYAGTGRHLLGDVSTIPPETSSHFRTLMKLPSGFYVVDGVRTPTLGFGLGQFCNDKRIPNSENAKIVGSAEAADTSSHQTSKLGLYIKATRDIKPGEEILISYDKNYWNRYDEDIHEHVEQHRDTEQIAGQQGVTCEEQKDMASAIEKDATTQAEHNNHLNAIDAMAERLLGEKGLHMKKIARDGHCLFTSVALLTSQAISSKELRKRAVEHVLDHYEQFKPHLTTRQPKQYKTREEYRKGLEHDQGDQPEIIAIGHIIKRHIIVHELDSINQKIHSLSVIEPEGSMGTIHLIRVEGNHFHAAEPDQDSSSERTRQSRTNTRPPSVHESGKEGEETQETHIPVPPKNRSTATELDLDLARIHPQTQDKENQIETVMEKAIKKTQNKKRNKHTYQTKALKTN